MDVICLWVGRVVLVSAGTSVAVSLLGVVVHQAWIRACADKAFLEAFVHYHRSKIRQPEK